ncbi:helix-turn-helix transcriptional regulator [Streptomyces sp. NPDC047002]|uniref:helix-turn-helix domain-containing protein n=1 Tax=Streptomyces sp. NPDC047002 TaxID=3155475 RepID=UPI0034550EB6
MLEGQYAFGSELRRARHAAGLTLSRLAARVHYSKAQLSKVETGQKRPSQELARLCDAALGTQGALLGLVPAPSVPRTKREAAADEEGGAAPARRGLLAAGAAAVLGTAATPSASAAPAADGALLDISRNLFAEFRRLGQSAPPGAVLPALAEQTRVLRLLARRSGARTRDGLIALSSRYAEFAGWMAQEAGDDQAALRLTDEAVELAAAAGDSDLASYARVRRALVSYYRGDAAETLALTATVSSPALPPRILGLAAVQEAEGHSLAGDHGSSMRALDRARALLARVPADPAQPVLGASHVPDQVAMITGWCLLDLGRPRQAAEVFDREMHRVAPTALRTRARYGTRQALAHALAGDIDQACALAHDVLSAVHTVGSATVALDVRRLSRTLARHPRHPAVKEVEPLLAFALSPAARLL